MKISHSNDIMLQISSYKSVKYFLTILVICFLFFCYDLSLKSQSETYWQQQVDYDIEATLNDEKHLLDAYLAMNYTNNSPDTLNFIYFHLWPNAFSTTKTAFAKQKRQQGSLNFHFVKPSELGHIKKMAFSVEGKAAQLVQDKENPDIAKLLLNKPLLPGQTISLETPFQVKIPNSYSRLGHVDQSYQITQWFPKPAVYDHKGWHPMPYLDQGEFYSEFGSFDVKITLPENYVVGATGDLQTESEYDFLNEKVRQTLLIDSFSRDTSIPASAAKMKTLHYTQKNIHDFAWFADKRFHVLKEEFTIPETGKACTAWAMFTNTEADIWTKGAEYVRDGVLFYSEKIGAYPFSQATAVQSALSAGAGMEYPQITVIGVSGNARSLENVIVHEVGHNWFYGQLATDERTYPWMDEGMNTYYEQRYFNETKSDEVMGEAVVPEGLLRLVGLDGLNTRDLYEKLLQVPARLNEDQAIDLASDEFTSTNYGLYTYIKPGLSLDYLQSYLGTKTMDRIMQEYYRQWEFKHPYPEDFKTIVQNETGKPTDWFFDELISTTKKVDYQFHKYYPYAQIIGKDTFDVLILRNHPIDNVAGPFPITAMKNGKPMQTIWYDGFHGELDVLFPAIGYDQLIIDYYHRLPENNRQNNYFTPKGKNLSTKVAILPKVEKDDARQLFITPIVGYNHYDKAMLGLAFYNSMGPVQNFRFNIAPMFALGSNEVTGTAKLDYTYFFSSKILSRVDFGLKAKRFSYDFYRDPETSNQLNLTYLRVAPEATAHVKYPALSKKETSLKYQFIYKKGEELATSIPSNSRPNTYFNEEAINQVTVVHKENHLLRPYEVKLTAAHGFDFLVNDAYGYLSLDAKLKLIYNKEERALSFRLFGGGFIDNKLIGGPENIVNAKTIGMTGLGEYDFTYDSPFFSRNNTNTLFGKQIYPDQGGGFKLIDFRGESQQWLTALNIEADIPFIPSMGSILRLKAFMDIGISADERGFYRQERRFTFEDDFLTDAGLVFSLFNDNAKIYWTIWYSDVFDNAKDRTFGEKISFYINLPALNPVDFVRTIGYRL